MNWQTRFFPWILRKQCVNKLFQLGVLFEIQRRWRFCKALIISITFKQQNLIEYHFARLIIWRSLVQAQAGPPFKIKQLSHKLSCFFFCFANTLRTQRLSCSNVLFAHFHAFLSCEHVFSSDFILPISGKQNSFNPVSQIARNTPSQHFIVWLFV